MSTPRQHESAAPAGEPTQVQTSVPAETAAWTDPTQPAQLGGYRLVQVLGEGGMGRVYLAEDARASRQVAVKVMKPELAAQAANRERFLREARAAAGLDHDHIVTIYQVGEEADTPFLVMPVLRGQALDARLKRDTRLPVAECLRVARETAEGLAAAHAKGLIHRDIKPANVWLEGDRGRVKILDFGLAKAADGGLTQSGAVMGTPAYMAPEQARGQPVDARTDLFSLGCVLYHAVTGGRPFPGGDTMAVLSSLAVDTPAAPWAVEPACPRPLSELTMRLLEKDPARRPGSAREVADLLRAMEAAEQSESELIRRLNRPAAASRLRTGVKWSAAGLVVAGLAVAALLTRRTPHAPAATPATPAETAADELRRVTADLDRTDPGWRLEELEAKRPKVPDERNGALRVAAIRRRPEVAEWDSTSPPERLAALAKRLDDTLLSPAAPLAGADIALFRTEREAYAAAVAESRQLVAVPAGRFPIAHTRDAFSTLLPDHQGARLIVRLLHLDALIRIHDRQPAGAVEDVRTMFNVGRYFDGEPVAIAHLIRFAASRTGVRTLERLLAQGDLPAADLAGFQAEFAALAASSALPLTARAVRAGDHNFFGALAAGDVSEAALRADGVADKLPPLTDESIRRGHLFALRLSTEWVGVTASPTDRQAGLLDDLQRKHEHDPSPFRFVISGEGDPVGVYRKLTRADLRHLAELRAAAAALAVERYRLTTGEWPRDLAGLVPAYLSEVPADPFDGKPLRYRRDFDGVLAYSVGWDRTDDQGRLLRTGDMTDGTDLGFQLWDAAKRGGKK